MTGKLGNAGRELKLQAANALKIAATDLDDGNPFSPANENAQDQLIAEWIRQNHPKQASEMIQTAGVQLSLAAQAVADGTAPMDQAVWKELQQKDPGWIDSQRQAADARMLAGLEEQAEKFIEASRAKQQGLQRKGPNNATTKHCNLWNRQMQGRMGEPARNLSGR